jgi:dolichol-phosphate mannosyltransferase
MANNMVGNHTSLSIIVPVHNEEQNLRELCRQLRDAIESLQPMCVEVLLVSDGSTDRSEPMIAEIVAQDDRFKGIFLTRNFGHQAAVSVGLEYSVGAIVSIIDGDLQDPPNEIPRLMAALEEGADIVYGVRRDRKEGWFKRAAYATFYRLLRTIADIEIPLDSGDFCCMRREVVDAILQLPECNRFVRGLRAWVGYRQVGVEYERSARHAGTPSFTLAKLVRLAYDGLFSFSAMPIRMMQALGFCISFAALCVATFYVVFFLLKPSAFPQGFATITVSIWLLAGVQLFFLGVLGEYVVRIFDEVRRRPTALVRQIVTNDLSVTRAPFEEIDAKLEELTMITESELFAQVD